MKKKSIFWKVTAIVVVSFIIGILVTQDSTTVTVNVSEVPSKEIPTTPVLFIGDIMLGRFVETLMKENGTQYPFSSEIDSLLADHTTIANLEGPIPYTHKPTPISGFSFSFPTSIVKVLKDHHIAAVSLANNHTLDQGGKGYRDTQEILGKGGISYFGAYDTTKSNYFETYVGTTSVIVFGINMVSTTWDEEKAISVAELLRKDHPNSILVAYIHWGNEYDHDQGDVQKDIAKKLIDGGVNVIVGMHPHVVQGIETYKNGIIFYSLGNFIFDQYFSTETQQSYGVSMNLNPEGLEFTLIPFVSKRSKVSLATSTNMASILETIAVNSTKELHDEILLGKVIVQYK